MGWQLRLVRTRRQMQREKVGEGGPWWLGQGGLRGDARQRLRYGWNGQVGRNGLRELGNFILFFFQLLLLMPRKRFADATCFAFTGTCLSEKEKKNRKHIFQVAKLLLRLQRRVWETNVDLRNTACIYAQVRNRSIIYLHECTLVCIRKFKHKFIHVRLNTVCMRIHKRFFFLQDI